MKRKRERRNTLDLKYVGKNIEKKKKQEKKEMKRPEKEKSISSYCLFVMFDKDTWRQCEEAR